MPLSQYDIHRRNLKLGIATNPKKEPKPLAKVSEKQKEKVKADKPQKDLLDDWYEEKVNELTDICMECEGPTRSAIFVMAKESVAHVLPKRKAMFPSVATHKHNHLELCVHCHKIYDSSWEDAAKMKVWPIAVERFKLICPDIAPMERKNIPDVFIQEVEPAW